MKTRPFIPEHLIQMAIQDNPDGMGNMDKDALLRRGTENVNGPAITLFADDGTIVGCGGIRRVHCGVGEAWSVPSESIGRYPKAVLETARAFLAGCVEYHRIQAIVVSGFLKAERLLACLGFQYEGTLRKYGPTGRDYKILSIVR